MVRGLYDNPRYVGNAVFNGKLNKIKKYLKKWEKSLSSLKEKTFKADYDVTSADINFLYDGMYFYLPFWYFKNNPSYLFDCLEKDIEKDLIDLGADYIEYKVKRKLFNKT